MGLIMDNAVNTKRVIFLLYLGIMVSACAAFRADPGAQFQASSIAYIAAVDAATELRKAGKLSPEQIEGIGVAVDAGRKVLVEWSIALQDDREYPDGKVVVGESVRAILGYIQKE